MNRLIEVLCICSGARKDASGRAPQGRAQSATLGLLMLLTAVFAALTSGYALSRVFLGDSLATPIAVGGGLAWGTLVFCIDRLMILGIDKLGSPLKLVYQVLARVPLAVMIAMVMSTPFILRLSQSITDAELLKQQRETIEQEFTANSKQAGLPERRAAVDRLTAARQQHEAQVGAEPTSFPYVAAKEALAGAISALQLISTANNQRIRNANAEVAQVTTVDREFTPAERARVDGLRRSIRTWQGEITAARRAVTTAEASKNAATTLWQADEREKLERTNEELTAAVEVEGQASSAVSNKNEESEEKVSATMRSTLINQYKTYRRITEDPKHPDHNALKTFEAALHLIFLLLELTPIIMKVMSRKGPMDAATAAVEQLDSDRINGDANDEMAHRQKMAEAKQAILEAAIESWRNARVAKYQFAQVQTADLRKLREELDKIAA